MPFFSQKKRGLAEKRVVSLLFCPSLRFLDPKKGFVPAFLNFYPRFFVKIALFEPPNALVTTKKARVETTPKSRGNEKSTERGYQGQAAKS